MKTPHLLRIELGPATFLPLFAAAHGLKLRLGWLELGGAVEPLPASLDAAAALGALRAVAVGEGKAVAVKPRRGAPILKDLLREHFSGCALVLVDGGEEAAPGLPLLRPHEGEGEPLWRIVLPGNPEERRFTSAALAAALGKPRPWEE